MTATREAVVSARVPLDLRRELELLASQDGHGELSIVARAALREYTDRRLGRSTGAVDAVVDNLGASLLRGGQGAARRHGTATERAAALAQAPRVGSARRRVLELLEDAGARGLTADEAQRALERAAGRGNAPPVNGTARRVTDLVQGGLATPRLDDVDMSITTRATRHGAQANVHVITPAGARALETARRREQENTRARP